MRIEATKPQQNNPQASSSTLSGQLSSSSSISQPTASPLANPVTASRSGRRVTPEQKKLLQAKAAQKSRSKQCQLSQPTKASPSSSPSSSRDGIGQNVSDAQRVADSSSDLGMKIEASPASAAQSLNNRPATSSSSSSVSSSPAVGKFYSRDANTSNSSHSSDIPLEDLSHKIGARTRSNDRKTAITIPSRDRFRFQRSLSHSPSRGAPRHPDTVTLIYSEKKDLVGGRRLSAPIMLTGSVPSPRQIPTLQGTKVSTAIQVGRPHSSSSPEPRANVGKVEPMRKRFLSGPSSAATLRAADSPSTSLLEAGQISSASAIPRLLPPSNLSEVTDRDPEHSFGSDESGIHSASSSPFSGGARPKQPLMGPYASSSATSKTASSSNKMSGVGISSVSSGNIDVEEGSCNTASGGSNNASSVSTRINELSLHGLQISGEKDASSAMMMGRKGKEGFVSGIGGNAAISPETPSSDSAVSSDASMISVSSMASESSMDVDSDNNAASVAAVAIATRGRPPASTSQQLTQLAQMVQEHYPYGSAESQKHTG